MLMFIINPSLTWITFHTFSFLHTTCLCKHLCFNFFRLNMTLNNAFADFVFSPFTHSDSQNLSQERSFYENERKYYYYFNVLSKYCSSCFFSVLLHEKEYIYFYAHKRKHKRQLEIITIECVCVCL